MSEQDTAPGGGAGEPDAGPRAAAPYPPVLPARNMTFAAALLCVLDWGAYITRHAWLPGHEWVASFTPAPGDGPLSGPLLVRRGGDGHLYPWLPDQRDLFAQDWAVQLQPAPVCPR